RGAGGDATADGVSHPGRRPLAALRAAREPPRRRALAAPSQRGPADRGHAQPPDPSSRARPAVRVPGARAGATRPDVPRLRARGARGAPLRQLPAGAGLLAAAPRPPAPPARAPPAPAPRPPPAPPPAPHPRP